MRRKLQCVAVVLCLQAALCLSSRADGFTNIVSGVSTNVSGYYVVGEADSFNYLEINSGGALTSLAGLLADQASSSNNSALITGSNSLWNCTGDIAIGENGSGNQLTITNGGRLSSVGGYIGDGIQANSNEVIVTGSNSVWNNGNANYLIVGNGGFSNQLFVLDGARVISNTRLFIGGAFGGYQGSNNTLTVAGANSLLMDGADFFMGFGSGNQLVVSNGAMFACAGASVGLNSGVAGNNVVTITGSNTVWNNNGSLAFGFSGGGNQLTISAGAVVSNTTAEIGIEAGSNTVVVDGLGTIWRNQGFYFGGSPNNTLLVTNGATIYSSVGVEVGGGSGANNNVVVVTGNNTVWNNSGSLVVGNRSYGNQFQVLGGAQMLVDTGMGTGLNSYLWLMGSSNTLIVAGANSRLVTSGSFLIEDGVGSQLLVNGGAKFSSADTTIAFSGSANIATITGSNSAWSVSGKLFVGSAGTNNHLIVNEGGTVSNGDCYIGNYGTFSAASGNLVLVSGTGTTWNSGCVYIGGSSGNSLVVSNGATVNDSCVNISGGPSNQVVVTGSNTTCYGGSINVGNPSGFLDILRIENGGQLLSGAQDAHVGSGGNGDSVVITGQGSSWAGIGLLMVGQATSMQIAIADGARLQAAHMIVFAPPPSVPQGLRNTGLSISGGGTLIVTNATNDARTELQLGDTALSGGIIVANNLLISSLISNQCQVTGCGTIIGNVSNYGTLAVNCPGGTLTILGIVTNNATIIATNNADFEFLGPVVNNGTINVINGFAHFSGGFVNHGTYVDASNVLRAPSLNFSGSNVMISFGCVSGKTYAVEYTDSMQPTNWIALVSGIVGNGGNTQFPDAGAASLTQRFYRVHLTLP